MTTWAEPTETIRVKPEGVKAYEAMRYFADWIDNNIAMGNLGIAADFSGLARKLHRILNQ